MFHVYISIVEYSTNRLALLCCAAFDCYVTLVVVNVVSVVVAVCSFAVSLFFFFAAASLPRSVCLFALRLTNCCPALSIYLSMYLCIYVSMLWQRIQLFTAGHFVVVVLLLAFCRCFSCCLLPCSTVNWFEQH